MNGPTFDVCKQHRQCGGEEIVPRHNVHEEIARAFLELEENHLNYALFCSVVWNRTNPDEGNK